jgi:hypothetical protein
VINDQNYRRVTKMNSKGLFGLSTFGRMAFGIGLLVVALGSPVFAGLPASTPEIDAGSMVSALALLSGAVLVVTNRVRRK